MKAGKLSPQALRRLVLDRITRGKRSDVVVGAEIGEDSAVIDPGGDLCVASSDPITGAEEGAGGLAVHVSCNDVAAMGASPVGVLLTILAPEGFGEDALAALMDEAKTAADLLGVEILGGHTEITSNVSAPIVTATALGRVERARLVRSSGARDGDALLMTKAAGLEGSAILASDYRDRLAGLGSELLEKAKEAASEISVVREGIIAARCGVSAMHDATEGGIVGAALEMAAASGLGVVIERGRVPVRPETAAICAHLGLDPLRLISSGAMLIASPDPGRVMRALKEAGISVAMIGRLQKGRSMIVEEDGSETPLGASVEDELWRFLAAL